MSKRIVDEEMRFTVIVNGDSAKKELFDIEKANRSLVQSNKDLRIEKAKLIKQGKQNTTEYKNLTAEIRKNNAQIKENKTRMGVLQKQIGVTGLTMRQLQQRASQLRLQLHNMVPGSAEHERYTADLKKINTQIFKLKANGKAAQSSLSKVAGGFNKYAALGASIIAAGTGIVLSLQKIIDYNGQLSDSQSNVQKTTGLTEKEVDKLTIKLGLLKTRTARIELLKLAEEAGRLGKEGVDDVFAFVKVANQLKVALGDDLGDEQIREVGKMVTIYKVGQKEGKNFEDSMLSLGSSINEVSASGANQADYLVDFLKRTAGVSSVANIAAQDIIGMAAAFDESGQSQEISATAINKTFISMAENSEKFAKIAGVSVSEFSRVLEEDANEALILFLKGLKQGDPTLEQMVKRLDGIELGGTRGAQAMTSLAANIENLESKQSIANKSLKEATSLTNEYNLKNNNLAGILDKVKKRLQAAFSSQLVTGTLTALTTMFGKLIGAITDVNEAFAEESKLTFESAKANRKLANESTNLLNRYNELTKDGVEPTKEAKEQLDIITLQLKDRLGESVMAIDQETGAYILNTKAVKEQIKIKRLAADEEASTLASRLKGVQERKKELSDAQQLAEKEFDLRKKFFEEQNKQDIEFFKNSNTLSPNEELEILEKAEGAKEYAAARRELQKVNSEINEQTQREIDLTEKLNELNFNAADVDALFNSSEPSGDTGPKEGDTKTMNGKTFVFRNGKWTIKSTFKPTGGSGSGDSKVNQAKKEADALLQLQRETEDQRLALIQNSFAREMQINDENQRRKVSDLTEKASETLQAYDKAINSGDTDLASSLLGQYNQLLDQIELAEDTHQAKRSDILESGIQAHIKSLQDQHTQEEQLRGTAHNNALTALGNNEEARKALQESYDRERLRRQKENEQALVAELQKVLDTTNFKGFDLDILSDEQLEEIKAKLASLGLSISEVNALLAKMRGEQTDGANLELQGLGVSGDVDLLGLSGEQWEQMFTRTETFSAGLAKAAMFAQAATEAFAMYHQFATAAEDRKLQKMQVASDREIANQKRKLDNKLISEKQYNDAVEAEELKMRKVKAEMEHKQAKREKAMSVASTISATALAVAKALPNIPLSVAVGVLGAAQLAMILAQPLPAKGFEKGFYGNTVAVQREQDGKLFNANFGGDSRSGVVDKPTMFLAGEGGKNFPELIVSGPDLKRFNPDLKNSLYRELGRVRGYENGFYKNVPQGDSTSNDDDIKLKMIEVVGRTAMVLERIEAEGIEAYMTRNFSNTRRMREDLEKLNNLENKAKIKS